MRRKILLTVALALCWGLAVQAKTTLKVAYAVKTTGTNNSALIGDTIYQTLVRNFDSVYVHVKNGAWEAADTTTLVKYDVIVAPFYFDGGNLSLARNLSKPVLIMHGGIPVTSYVAPGGGASARWYWVPSKNHNEGVGYEFGAVNQNSVVLESAADKNTGIYTGLKFVGNSVRILSDVVVGGDGCQGLVATAQPRTKANASVIYPAPATGVKYVIYYEPKGSAPDGSTMLKSDYCYIGLHSSSFKFLTQNGKQLLINTVQKLAGVTPTGTEEMGGTPTPSCGAITLNKAALPMQVSNMERLTAEQDGFVGEADNVIQWASSNPAVATVDYTGMVRALATGNATITASVAGGTVTATCAVTVSAGARLMLSENFVDWELRNSKMGPGLTPNDTAPNQAPAICDTFTVTRNLIGGGAVDFTMYNVAVVPYLGTKYGNEVIGCLAITKNGTVKTNPVATDPNYNPKQGNDGTVTAAKGAVAGAHVIIGRINKATKIVELTVSVEGGGRGGNIQKSYDGTTWMNVDAVVNGTPGTIGKLVPTNCRANTYSISFPAPDSNFYLKVGPGGNAADNPMAGVQTFRIHEVKYYAPAAQAPQVNKITIDGARTRTIYAPGANSDRRDSMFLTYTYAPALAQNGLVTWTSTNPSAATIDANTGKLRAATKDLDTKIVATAKDGSGVTDTITVLVREQIDVQSVKINAPSVSIHALESYQLTATVLPANAGNPTLIYTSMYPAIATVDSGGLLTANLKGWVSIIATSTDGTNKKDTLDIEILPAVYVGGDPKPDAGAPKLPMVFNARASLSPTQQTAPNTLDEVWAKDKWFDFAKTGLRKEKANDSVQNFNYSRMQGVYLNGIVEGGNTADFANIGLKTTKASGRQTRLIFAFDGELDSLKLGIVVTGSSYPSTVAIQESNDAESWNDLHYVVNATSMTKETENAALLTELTENVYKYPVIKGFNKNSRFVRLFQTESGSGSATSHNIYIDGIWLYGTSTTTGVSKDNSVADYGISVYPNPTKGEVYLAGEKAISRVLVVNLHSGQVMKRASLGGATSTSVSMDNLTGGTYLFVIFVEGSHLPQVVKVSKQ